MSRHLRRGTTLYPSVGRGGPFSDSESPTPVRGLVPTRSGRVRLERRRPESTLVLSPQSVSLGCFAPGRFSSSRRIGFRGHPPPPALTPWSVVRLCHPRRCLRRRDLGVYVRVPSKNRTETFPTQPRRPDRSGGVGERGTTGGGPLTEE